MDPIDLPGGGEQQQPSCRLLMALLGKTEPELRIRDILVVRIRIRGSVYLRLTWIRLIYLGEANNSNPAAGQLMALLGKTEPASQRCS